MTETHPGVSMEPRPNTHSDRRKKQGPDVSPKPSPAEHEPAPVDGPLLAIDCAAELLSLAIEATAGGEYRYIELQRDAGLHHAERIAVYAQRLCGELDILPSDLRWIAVTSGPGSFTGLRIGMATAKGIRAASGAEIVGVPTLDAYAHRCPAGLVVPVIDARRSRYYAAIFREGARLSEDLDLSAGDVIGRIASLRHPGEPVVITGPHAPRFVEAARSVASRTVGATGEVAVTGERSTVADTPDGWTPQIDENHRRNPGRRIAALGRIAAAEGNVLCDEAGPSYLRLSEAEETRAPG